MKRMSVRIQVALLALVLCCAGTLSFDSAHGILHRDAVSDLHSLLHEYDPFHRYFYHDGLSFQDQQDKHTENLSTQKKCPFCQYSFHTEYLVSRSHFKPSSSYNSKIEYTVAENFSSSNRISYSPRGPPFLL